MPLKYLRQIEQIPPKCAPFYSQAPGLGKRAAMGLLRGRLRKPAAICGAVCVAIRTIGA